MEADWLVIAILLAVAVLLIALDFYLPGFILGSIGIVLMVIALVICYRDFGLVATCGLLIGEVIIGCGAGYVTIKYGPRTATGKKMILAHDQANQRATAEPSAQLLGREGVAHTVLRPAGVATIDGRRLDVVAEGAMIERGSAVRVSQVDGARIVVRKI
jgi:membrane-bound serine protease (ClpP class)